MGTLPFSSQYTSTFSNCPNKPQWEDLIQNHSCLLILTLRGNSVWNSSSPILDSRGHRAGHLVFLHDCVLSLWEKAPSQQYSQDAWRTLLWLMASAALQNCYRGSLLCSSDLVRICLNISLPSFSSSLPLAIILLADNFTSKLNFACVELLFFYGTHTHNLLTSVFWSLNLLHFSWWESPLNPMSVFLWCGHFILWIPLNIIAEYNIRICSTLSQETAFSMELTVFFRKEKKNPKPKMICKGQGMRSVCQCWVVGEGLKISCPLGEWSLRRHTCIYFCVFKIMS